MVTNSVKSSAFQHKKVCLDGNEACSYVAYRTNEIAIIYPITPSSGMGELADEWAAGGTKNIWGTVPQVVEMQSEAGAAGALHGALQTGALATTFTASQGLLLMIPNMYRIAGELTPTVFHVATRVLAYQGMSIYCDHSDVMATRGSGFAMLASNSVQEAHDFALIAAAVSLKTKVPFLHFFDGFRTSHEVAKIDLLSDDTMRAMLSSELIFTHRKRRLSPENPCLRGAVQNADIVFQARESVAPFYAAVPKVLAETMQQFAELTGRNYAPVDYYGAPDAEKVIVVMGSGAETIQETVDYLNKQKQKVGLIKIRLFRPFPKDYFLKALPKSVCAIAVLDRVKESGASGEPLYTEVATTLLEAASKVPTLIGGRFGLGNKEFTPAMVKAVFNELDKENPKNSFTVGINDDVSGSSLPYDHNFDIEPPEVIRAIFYGLGADGTVGANKNSIKIIGEETELQAQAYFVYDSKKSGSKTISHLRFGPKPIHSAYLIKHASFIGCHHFGFADKFNVLENAAESATFLLNSIYGHEEVWQNLPRSLQETIIEKKISFYVIDAYKVAHETGMGGRINTIMQTCFFALSKVLPKELAIAKIKEAIKKTYADKGEQVVKQNFAAVDYTLENLFKVQVPKKATSEKEYLALVPAAAPEFVRKVTAVMLADRGDTLPVSAIPFDGTYPLGTTQYEKRNVALQAPVWNSEACVQCGQCSMVCPHSVLRAKFYQKDILKNAPKTFKSAVLRDKKLAGGKDDYCFTIQAYVEDCTACGLCVETCPVKVAAKKAINLELKPQSLDEERKNIAFFEAITIPDSSAFTIDNVRNVQYLPPYFEFCGACAGCGEAPYVRLLTQLFGDRLLLADACGCTLVYCSNLPTTPLTVNAEGKGPAYSGSLFEDNAEFGFGFVLTHEKHREYALELLERLKAELGADVVAAIKSARQHSAAEVAAQRVRLSALQTKLAAIKKPEARELASLTDHLIEQSIWAFGGDGWAYDIGFGGLDHVLASGRKINILVLDTEVYSNTGGQASKATPRGAVVKFAAKGKPTAKKDLGLMMITYGNIYVASIALGANPNQAIKALQEAERYPGPSLIIAYSPCIAHGIDMRHNLDEQRLAVKSGYWPLYRYNPERLKEGLSPMQLDSEGPTIPLKDYLYNENRFSVLKRSNPELAEHLLHLAEEDVAKKWRSYRELAGS